MKKQKRVGSKKKKKEQKREMYTILMFDFILFCFPFCEQLICLSVNVQFLFSILCSVCDFSNETEVNSHRQLRPPIQRWPLKMSIAVHEFGSSLYEGDMDIEGNQGEWDSVLAPCVWRVWDLVLTPIAAP